MVQHHALMIIGALCKYIGTHLVPPVLKNACHVSASDLADESVLQNRILENGIYMGHLSSAHTCFCGLLNDAF